MAGPSRFDPSSPASVAGATFSTARKGFAPDEVRSALTTVSHELGRLGERVRQLEAELALAKRENAQPVELDEAALTERVGVETVRVLQTARESANQIKVRAEENAARLVAEATDEVARMRHDAELEIARKRADAASDAEAEVALAKQQGREMVNEARAYRERVLADLEARTSRARQQLEELAHGRERLLQVFERARLVAIDVATELGKHPGPQELVNLANVTGPVPVVVPDRGADLAGAPDGGIDDRTVAELAQPEGAAGEYSEAGQHSGADDGAPDEAAVDDVAPSGVESGDAYDQDGEAPSEPVAPDRTVAESVPEQVEPADRVDQAAAEPDDDVLATDAGADADEAQAESPESPESPEAPEPSDVPVADAAPDDEAGSPELETEGATAPVVHDADPPPENRDNVVALFARLREEAGGVATAEHPAVTPLAVVPDPVDTNGSAAQADTEVESVVEASPFSRRDEALVPLIVSAARRLKRVLADEQNVVLDVLRGRDAVTALAAILPDADEHAATYANAIDEELTAAAKAGAAEVGGSLGKSALSALDAARQGIRNELVGALRDRLDRSVAAGGGDNADVTRGVRNVYREWKTQHIDTQLDDVFRAAFAGGASAAVKSGTPVSWLREPGHVGCADCEDNSLAGAVPAGEKFPTGHTVAPAHPGCRCLVLPAAQ